VAPPSEWPNTPTCCMSSRPRNLPEGSDLFSGSDPFGEEDLELHRELWTVTRIAVRKSLPDRPAEPSFFTSGAAPPTLRLPDVLLRRPHRGEAKRDDPLSGRGFRPRREGGPHLDLTHTARAERGDNLVRPKPILTPRSFSHAGYSTIREQHARKSRRESCYTLFVN
jgi:hypothetical protein